MTARSIVGDRSFRYVPVARFLVAVAGTVSQRATSSRRSSRTELQVEVDGDVDRAGLGCRWSWTERQIEPNCSVDRPGRRAIGPTQTVGPRNWRLPFEPSSILNTDENDSPRVKPADRRASSTTACKSSMSDWFGRAVRTGTDRFDRQGRSDSTQEPDQPGG